MENQTISRKNLKKIHDVACEGWQKKLADYAARNPFEDEIELTGKEIDEMFAASNADQIKVLKKFFIRNNIMSKITCYADACKALGISSSEKRSAYERLCIIIKALNEGWYPNFNNRSEYKYWNYFYMVDGVFSYSDTTGNLAHMYVPSALYLKSRELAEYAKDIAFEEYKETYM